ncbi:MAG: lipoyl protein ligase domain-containing protein [Spirochaetia bacterium]
MRSYVSRSLNVYENLALEESLYKEAQNDIVLMFYRNTDSVVFGRHQNPFAEFLFPLPENCLPARRISGGGCVFHDAGNLNVSLIMDKTGFSKNILQEALIQALGEFSLPLSPGEKGDLFFAGKKVSGSAYAFSKNRAMHHASLLLQSNLEKLITLLQSNCGNISGNRVNSRPSKVINLFPDRDISVIVPEIIQAVIKKMADIICGECTGLDYIHPLHAVQSQDVKAVSSWNRLFGKTPDFTYTHRSADKTLVLSVKKGRIASCKKEDGSPVSALVDKGFDEYLCQELQVQKKTTTLKGGVYDI